MGIALAGVSLPIFFTGLIALAFFSYRLRITAPGGTYVPFSENPALWAYSLLLPWITLAFLFAAQYARLTRAGMLETMTEDYVRTARAKGLGEREVVGSHALRNSLLTVVTILGLQLGLLISGAVVTEQVFVLPGFGKLTLDAVFTRDYPVIQGVVLVTTVGYVVVNFAVDLLYSVLNPRIRVAGGEV
jgi:peptide/nickel transport system permease protein